jgi:hypothetical protein
MDRLTLILALMIPLAFLCGARLGATWTRLGDVVVAHNVRSRPTPDQRAEAAGRPEAAQREDDDSVVASAAHRAGRPAADPR